MRRVRRRGGARPSAKPPLVRRVGWPSNCQELVANPNVHPTALVGPEVALGEDVTVGPFTVIDGPTTIGDGSTIASHCLIGEGGAHGPLTIGAGSVVRSHCVIYGGSTYGDKLETGHHVSMREGNRVGRNLRIGTLCNMGGHATVGDYVRFTANVHICQRATLGSFIWILAWTLLTNDPHPPSDSCTEGPTIEDLAVLTSGITVLPNVRIGRGAFVSSNALVTRDVPPERIVRGTPAKDAGPVRDLVCKHGSGEFVAPWWEHFQRGYDEQVVFGPDGPRVRSELE